MYACKQHEESIGSRETPQQMVISMHTCIRWSRVDRYRCN